MRTLTLIIYAACGFMTFGFAFNAQPGCGARDDLWPVMAGAGWPAYWLGLGAIAITKPGE